MGNLSAHFGVDLGHISPYNRSGNAILDSTQSAYSHVRKTKTYRGGLPKQDRTGRWRAVVGHDRHGVPVRFQVGTRNTSEAEALRRLNAIRDLYKRQCADFGQNHWAPWVQEWATKLTHAIPVVAYTPPKAIETGVSDVAEYLMQMGRISCDLPPQCGVKLLRTHGTVLRLPEAIIQMILGRHRQILPRHGDVSPRITPTQPNKRGRICSVFTP